MQIDRIHGLANMVAGLAHKMNTPLGVANTANLNLQDLIAELEKTAARDHSAGLVENSLSLIETDVEKLNQIVDRSLGQAIDIVDAVFRKGVSLLWGHAFDYRQRHRRDHVRNAAPDLSGYAAGECGRTDGARSEGRGQFSFDTKQEISKALRQK